MPNSLITIVINLAWAKLLPKFFMDEGVERLLTGRKTGERQFFGPDMIQEAEEQVRIVRES